MITRELKIPINDDAYKGPNDGLSKIIVSKCIYNIHIKTCYLFIFINIIQVSINIYSLAVTPLDEKLLESCVNSNIWVFNMFTITLVLFFMYYDLITVLQYKILLNFYSPCSFSEKKQNYLLLTKSDSNIISNEEFNNIIYKTEQKIFCLNVTHGIISVGWLILGLIMLNDKCIYNSENIYLLILSIKITNCIMFSRMCKALTSCCCNT